MAELQDAIREFHGDPRRVYLTGISMGGAGDVVHGPAQSQVGRGRPGLRRSGAASRRSRSRAIRRRTWRASSARPIPTRRWRRQIGRTPMWAFHGAKDDVVPVTESRSMVAALRQTAATSATPSIPNGAHDIWDAAYADAGMVHWMLQQKMR